MSETQTREITLESPILYRDGINRGPHWRVFMNGISFQAKLRWEENTGGHQSYIRHGKTWGKQAPWQHTKEQPFKIMAHAHIGNTEIESCKTVRFDLVIRESFCAALALHRLPRKQGIFSSMFRNVCLYKSGPNKKNSLGPLGKISICLQASDIHNGIWHVSYAAWCGNRKVWSWAKFP